MTIRDLQIIKKLLTRTENLPDILHLRAAPIGYEFTEDDKKLIIDTYQELDDILKEVAAFINVKFKGRQDYIQPWNDIDFDTKIGPIKIKTTDREHIKSAWKTGIFDLKSLIKSLINEVTLLVEEQEIKNAEFNIQDYEKYLDSRIEKRVEQADFFLDIIIEKRIINLDKSTLRKYFKQWFTEAKDFDLQILNGDFIIEDGDINVVPIFTKDNIPEFLKWFESEGNKFIDYLKDQGINVEKGYTESIINKGNIIINKRSNIKKLILNNKIEKDESIWSKANVIIAFVVGIVTIVGIVLGIIG